MTENMNENMNENMTDKFDEIKKVIGEEKEGAIQTFEANQEEFKQRLFQKIDELNTGPTVQPEQRRKWFSPFYMVPAATAIILVISLTLVFKQPVPQQNKHNKRRDVDALKQIFRKAALALEGDSALDPLPMDRPMDSVPKYDSPEKNRLYNDLAWLLEGGFYKTGAPEFNRENLRKIFENLFCLNCKQRDAAQEPVLLPLDPNEINLEERIKHLKKKKMKKKIGAYFLNKKQIIS